MGGTNEDTISGLRIHVNNGDIHFHDDSRSIKFELDLEDLKKEVEESFNALKKKEGMVEIQGNTKTSLCLIKKQGKFNIFLLDNSSSIKQKLINHLKDC